VLEDPELPALLLLLPSIMQAQYCLMHHAGKVKNFVDLVRSWDTSVLIAECNSNFRLR
jgi:hypothetical protein